MLRSANSGQLDFSRLTAPALSKARRETRLLYFAGKECWPPNTGAKLRNYHLARELSCSLRLTYLGFSDNHDSAQAKKAPLVAGMGHGLDGLAERTITVEKDPGYKLSNLVKGALSRTPLTVLNYTTPAMERQLRELMDETSFDVIQVEGVHLSAYLPILRAAPGRPLVVCDWHNVESELMSRYSKFAPSLPRRYYARATARKLQTLERAVMTRFDAHIVVSERDRARLLEMAPEAQVLVVENGVDAAHYTDESIEMAYADWAAARLQATAHTTSADNGNRAGAPLRNRIVFVGSMDYHANIDAAIHFAQAVWPSLYRQRPELVFTIVGRSPAYEVRALATTPGVEVTGTVDDVRPYYREAAAAVVPLRIGGGSRLKILEAMAAGIPVVSSPLGAEGLDVRHDESVLLADTPEAFGGALLNLCHKPEQWHRLSWAGRVLASERYAWKSLGESLAAFYGDLMKSRASGRSEIKVKLAAQALEASV